MSWSANPALSLLCGHYEGVDERVREYLVTDEISLGDFVLTGGELAAMVIVDAVSRLIPGVLATGSTVEESHRRGCSSIRTTHARQSFAVGMFPTFC